MRKPVTLSLLPLLALSQPGLAQSLFQRPVTRPDEPPAARPIVTEGERPPAENHHEAPARPATSSSPARLNLASASLFVVVPPKPKAYQKHDKVEVLINESTTSKAEQKLETKKNYTLSGELTQVTDLKALLKELALRDGIGTNAPDVGVKGSNNFKGNGTYERKDQFTTRISAIVIDVKPNGQLLLEAREVIQKDAETQTVVLTGLADPKDITSAGTVQSSQLANLTIRMNNEGRVKDAGEKGFIPRIFEAIFNF